MHMLKYGYAVELDPYFGEGCRILPHSIVHEGHIEMKSTSTCELRTADGQKRFSWIFLDYQIISAMPDHAFVCLPYLLTQPPNFKLVFKTRGQRILFLLV